MRTLRQDLRMIRMAARKGWGVPDERREVISDRMFELFMRTEDERNAIQLGKTMMVCDLAERKHVLDVARDKTAAPAVNVAVQVNNGVQSPGELKKVPPDELIRIHRESLGLPVSDQDEAASSSGE